LGVDLLYQSRFGRPVDVGSYGIGPVPILVRTPCS
jgi:hypothetical protein